MLDHTIDEPELAFAEAAVGVCPLDKASAMMVEARVHWGDPGHDARLEEALCCNERCWDAFQSEATRKGCLLAEPDRNELIALSLMVGKRVFATRLRPDSSNLDVLIEINNRVSDYICSLRTGKPVPADPESVGGKTNYLEVLEFIHRSLVPEFYLEIGVRNGGSLRFAVCDAIGVDPAANITFPLGAKTRLVHMTSDDYFDSPDRGLPRPVDLAFIDGMHLFEFALRDFINIEKVGSPYSVVVIDDIFPNHPLQASRDRKTRVWTGDVWKLRHCLEAWRPDLRLILLDTSPTGLMLIMGLDPESRVLQTHYEEIKQDYSSDKFNSPPDDVVARRGAIFPDFAVLDSVLKRIGELKKSGSSGSLQTIPGDSRVER